MQVEQKQRKEAYRRNQVMFTFILSRAEDVHKLMGKQPKLESGRISCSPFIVGMQLLTKIQSETEKAKSLLEQRAYLQLQRKEVSFLCSAAKARRVHHLSFMNIGRERQCHSHGYMLCTGKYASVFRTAKPADQGLAATSQQELVRVRNIGWQG